MRFFIKTYGCQMNVNDSEKMRHILEGKGMNVADSESDADIIIINSCAVREKPQEKIYSYAGRIARDTNDKNDKGKNEKGRSDQGRNDKIIIAAGCVAQVEKNHMLERCPAIDYVVGTHQYYKIDEIIDELIEKKMTGGVRTGLSREWQEAVPAIDSRTSRVSGFISIMEGCDNFCSYCIVPFTRGREKHRSFPQIMEEARFLSENGYQEIILLGQNVNNWEDPGQKMKFPQLLDQMAREINVKWIRFITSYPGYYEDDIIDVMARHRKIARNIHFPAQSGSTRILKKMNRIYTRSQYIKIIERWKKQVPGVTFSSDFIVGFPGETRNDHRLTLSLLEKVEYENVFSFIYSPRQHTKAAKLEDKVDIEEKKQRLYQLQEVQKNIQLKKNRALIGQTIDVLVTEPHPRKAGDMIGRTEHYRVVNFLSTTPPGQFTRVKIENAGPYSLRGVEPAAVYSSGSSGNNHPLDPCKNL